MLALAFRKFVNTAAIDAVADVANTATIAVKFRDFKFACAGDAVGAWYVCLDCFK